MATATFHASAWSTLKLYDSIWEFLLYLEPNSDQHRSSSGSMLVADEFLMRNWPHEQELEYQRFIAEGTGWCCGYALSEVGIFGARIRDRLDEARDEFSAWEMELGVKCAETFRGGFLNLSSAHAAGIQFAENFVRCFDNHAGPIRQLAGEVIAKRYGGDTQSYDWLPLRDSWWWFCFEMRRVFPQDWGAADFDAFQARLQQEFFLMVKDLDRDDPAGTQVELTKAELRSLLGGISPTQLRRCLRGDAMPDLSNHVELNIQTVRVSLQDLPEKAAKEFAKKRQSNHLAPSAD